MLLAGLRQRILHHGDIVGNRQKEHLWSHSKRRQFTGNLREAHAQVVELRCRIIFYRRCFVVLHLCLAQLLQFGGQCGRRLLQFLQLGTFGCGIYTLGIQLLYFSP